MREMLTASRLFKALGVAIALGLCSQGSMANDNTPDFQVQAKGMPHDFLYGMSFEGVKGVAVGNYGLLLTSADGGGNWNKVESPLKKQGLLSVVRAGGKCLASGLQGSVIRSDDCVNWESVKPITDARLLAIHTNSRGQAYAVGSFGTVIRSLDWGKTWSALNLDWKGLLGSDTEPHLYTVRVAEDGSITLAGEFELVVRSTNAGASWNLLHKGERSIFGLSIGAKGKMFAVGQEGLILRSSDSGKTWDAVKSATKAVLTDVWASSDDGFVAVVGVRALLVSRNSGNSFAPNLSSVGKTQVFATVSGVESQGGEKSVLLGGASGEILRNKF